MKHKIYFIAFLAFFIAVNVNGQTGNPAALFNATITQTSSNSLMASFKPNITFSGQFSNLQFTFQIPSSVSPQPTISIKSNPLSAFVPTGGYTVDTRIEGSYITYSYNVIVAGAPVFNFVGGTDYNALEVSFSASSSTTPIRLAHLANGGSTSQQAFYVEINGNDNTDYTTTFNGTGAVNGGSYSSYSFVEVANFVLPVKFTSFTVNKKDDNGLLNWTVVNETASVNHYEIERSVDGIIFYKINSFAKAINLSNENSYKYVDQNIAAVKSNGTVYYRIKQVDVDGRFVYSKIRNVKTSDKNSFVAVYPNPVENTTSIEVNAPAALAITFSLINNDGRILQTNSFQGVKGINVKRIAMNSYPSGSYLLKLMMGNELQTIKIIKK